MKFILPAICSLLTISVSAQVKIVDKAIIKMKTEITFPENMGGNSPGEGDRVMMMGGAGGMEANTTMYYRGDFSKVESTSDFGNNIVITDRKNKKTTTLTEAMGRKVGFYSTEEDELAMRSRMDSARNARRDSLEKAGIPITRPAKPEIEYTNETKKIAGYTCKKAIIKSKNQRGEVNSTIVWYSPDFKMAEGFSFGGGSGGRGMMSMAGVNGLDQIEGFPMEYQIERTNGMKMHMTVTKVQLDAAIEDKVFEIPKGYDIKPMKDMQGGDGRMIMRMGSGGNQ
jgi:GLPGLI family protein